MDSDASDGIDPRIDLIAQRVQQLEQMVAATDNTVGDPNGQDHAKLMMQQVLQRMRNFIESQAESTDPSIKPENRAKACEVLQVIKQVQAKLGLSDPPHQVSLNHGHTGLEGLPISGSHDQSDNNDPPDPVQIEKQKIARMSGEIATNAPHRQENWISYPANSSEGPIDSLLHGGGHYSPPVFGWGELVKETDPKPKKLSMSHINTANHTMLMMPHEMATSGQVIYKTLPIFGRIRFLTDFQGVLCWTIIVIYWCLGNYSTWFCILLPQYADGNISVIWLIIYAIVSSLCITSHLRASTMNPGKVPYYVSKDSIDHPDWTYCDQCERKRPPRAHHCRRCQQCVVKMDHHCPWINNCVGENNQWVFILLITYAQILSSFSLAFNILWYWYLPPCASCDPKSFPIFHQKFFITVVTVMAILMIFFSMSLLCSQNMGIMVDFTTLEWMILERKVMASGKMPDSKDMPQVRGSIYRKYRQLCGDTSCIFWPFPCRNRRAPTFKDMQDV